MDSISELRTALKAARYQLSRTRAGSKQRYALLSLIRDYESRLSTFEVAA